MSTLREQFSAARKAQVELQLDFVRNLTSNVVDSTGKVLALNISTGRNSLEKSADTLRKLVTASSPRELADLPAQSQSGFDSLLQYGSELFNIASRAQADLLKAALPAAAAATIPTPALRALPSAEVEVEVLAEVPPAAQPALEPAVADPDAVAAVSLNEAVQVREPEPAPEPQAAAPAEPASAPAPAIEIVDEVPVPREAVKANPLAEAVREAVGEAQSPVLDAAPLAVSIPAQVTISGIEPVEAAPPPAPAAGNPLARGESQAPKGRRKK